MQGVECRVQSAEFGVQDAGCRVQGVGCRVQGVGCRVQGAGCRVRGIGCRVRPMPAPARAMSAINCASASFRPARKGAPNVSKRGGKGPPVIAKGAPREEKTWRPTTRRTAKGLLE